MYESDAAGDMVLKGAQDLIRTYGWVQGESGIRFIFMHCLSPVLFWLAPTGLGPLAPFVSTHHYN